MRHRTNVILDMDETMIHTDHNTWGLIYRPGLVYFLNTLAQFTSISVFTAGTQGYADPILDSIEKQCGRQIFNKRLYRHNADLAENGSYIKDIKKYFNIDQSILIDDNITSISMYPNNSLYIKPFYGDKNDDLLYNILPFIINFSMSNQSSISYVNFIRPFLEDLHVCTPF